MWITQWRKGDGWLIFSPTRSVYSEPPTSSRRRSSRSAATTFSPWWWRGGCRQKMHAPLWVGWEAARGAFSVGHLWIRCWAAARTHVHLVCVYKKTNLNWTCCSLNSLLRLLLGKHLGASPHCTLAQGEIFLHTLGRQTFLLLFMWVSLFFQPGENLNAHHASLTTDSIKFSTPERDAFCHWLLCWFYKIFWPARCIWLCFAFQWDLGAGTAFSRVLACWWGGWCVLVLWENLCFDGVQKYF